MSVRTTLDLARWRARPLVGWAATVALALLTAGVVHELVSRAEAARADYGRTEVVAVALADLPAGHVVAPGDVELRAVPVGLLADGAVTAPAEGRSVVEPVAAGEVVLARRLSPDGLGPVAGLLGPGHRGVAVPLGPTVPPLAVRDRVDLVAVADGGVVALGSGPAARVVARRALVVAVGEDAVTVAVTDAELVEVAAALAQGAVLPALDGA